MDAEKVERERRLYEVVTAFHEARVERDEAIASAGRHEAVMAARLGNLLDMGEPLDRVATLCDLTEAEARGLRRRAFPAGRRTGVLAEQGPGENGGGGELA